MVLELGPGEGIIWADDETRGSLYMGVCMCRLRGASDVKINCSSLMTAQEDVAGVTVRGSFCRVINVWCGRAKTVSSTLRIAPGIRKERRKCLYMSLGSRIGSSKQYESGGRELTANIGVGQFIRELAHLSLGFHLMSRRNGAHQSTYSEHTYI